MVGEGREVTVISSYLSNHVQLNKINNRAHNSYTAGLAATVQLSVCLTTGAIRTSLHYQGITLNTAAAVACAVPEPARRPQQGGGRGGGGVSSPILSLCCLWTLTLCSEACFVEFNQTLHLPTLRTEVRSPPHPYCCAGSYGLQRSSWHNY